VCGIMESVDVGFLYTVVFQPDGILWILTSK